MTPEQFVPRVEVRVVLPNNKLEVVVPYHEGCLEGAIHAAVEQVRKELK